VVVRLDGHAPNSQDLDELDDLAVGRACRRRACVGVQQLERASVRAVDAGEHDEHVDVIAGHARDHSPQVHICCDQGAHRHQQTGETKAVR
jgi:hypothetical protein